MAMTVGELKGALAAFPDDMPVEIEVHDHGKTSIRLSGGLWLVEAEGDEVNLFARHGVDNYDDQ